MFGFSGLLGVATQRRPGDERRNGGRVATTFVSCALGDIVDLSKSGMRVRAARRDRVAIQLGVPMDLQLEGLVGMLTLRAKPVWIKPVPRGACEIGFQFVDLDDHQTAALAEIASVSLDAERR